MVWSSNIGTLPLSRSATYTPVRDLNPRPPNPYANRQRTELRLGSRARLSPSTRGTNRAADGAGGGVGDLGVGRLAELDTPGREAPGRHPPHRLTVY